MASPSLNKSSSLPILSRRNPNAVLRNSEIGNPVRKSFAGNPVVKPSIIASSRSLNPKTPGNSPFGSRDFDEKENEKDHNPKPARVRSPTIPNGAKNFMSPTISASSKIAMSPKKKILVEKNESVRTSLSNSVDIHEGIQPTRLIQKPTDSNNDFSSADASPDLTDLRPALRASSSIPKPSKTVTFIDCIQKHPGSSSNTMFENADVVDLADRFKISPTSSCPILAPLDADPSMPPYDSKTNYLSPRPQFLLYRPNPRRERYLHKEEDGKRLEESFLSDSFSDNEVTEETQSESFQNSDEDGFVEKVEQEEEDNEEQEEKQSTLDENSEPKGNCKTFCQNPYKLTALILLLCFACSAVLYKNPLAKNNYPSEIYYQFTKLSYPEFAKNFWVLSKNVVDYAYGVILNFGEDHALIHPVLFFNLTALQEDISVNGYFVFDQTHGRMGDFLSEPTMENVVESESLEAENELLQKHVDLEGVDEVYSEVIEEPEPSYEEQERQESELHEGLEENGPPESEVAEMNNNLEMKDEKLPLKPVRVEEAHKDSFELPEGQLLLSGENGAVEKNHNPEVKDEKLPLKPEGVEEAEEESSKLDVKLNDDASESFELPDGQLLLSGENGAVEMNHNPEVKDEKLPLKPEGVEEAEEESSKLDVKLNDDASESFESSAVSALSNMNQFIALILLLPPMAAAIYFYSRRVKIISSNAKKPKAKNLSSSKDDNLIHRPLFQNFLTEGDMNGESCPSELSSFQKSSSYDKKGARGAGSNNPQSQEMKLRKNYRRESVSSSLDYSISTYSPSYGSFTAYKKISTKHSNCDEEVVETPVRRSSRINQVKCQ